MRLLLELSNDHIQVLDIKPPGSAGLDEEAHLHRVVNSLCALISVTICVLSQAGEMGALQVFPGGEHREDCLFCVCRELPWVRAGQPH